MSTHFTGVGNIGSVPEFRTFSNPKNKEKPHTLLRLNVRFDNPVPVPDKENFEDRGGFWINVELWHAEENWATLYQKGMRILVTGVIVQNAWESEDGQPRTNYQVNARQIGILPHRLERITMKAREESAEPARSSGRKPRRK
jgi:single-strand DNA-binding protein